MDSVLFGYITASMDTTCSMDRLHV